MFESRCSSVDLLVLLCLIRLIWLFRFSFMVMLCNVLMMMMLELLCLMVLFVLFRIVFFSECDLVLKIGNFIYVLCVWIWGWCGFDMVYRYCLVLWLCWFDLLILGGSVFWCICCSCVCVVIC